MGTTGATLAAIDGGTVLALVFAAFVVFVVLLTLYVKVREALWLRKIRNRVRHFCADLFRGDGVVGVNLSWLKIGRRVSG